ncbi:MAG: SdpI family protein [Anaerolineales bacterium]|nr:SdpI family protein [Anaerolineales bacterium]
MTIERKFDWIAAGAIGLAFAVTLLLWQRLPDPIPIHWNAAGQPDDFAPRAVGALLLPGIATGIYLLFELLPVIDPRGQNYSNFADTYRFLRRAFILFLVFVHGLMLYAILLGDNLLSTWLVTAGVGFLLMLIGNYLPRVRSNWFVGIRTPWTLASDVVWRRTHRRGGQVFVAAGLLIILASFLPSVWQVLVPLAAILAAAVTPIVYSYVAYRELDQSQEGSDVQDAPNPPQGV